MEASDKNPERVAAGLKASVHNPHVSEAAKERARERLSEMGIDPQSTSSASGTGMGMGMGMGSDSAVDESPTDASFARGNTGNVLGGYKATLKNPHVSSDAKEHAKEVLEENDAF